MNATGIPAKFLDRERSALDLPVAGLAALAVAFAAFTVPDSVLGRAVEATGLPSVLAAAQPPLGNTARLSMAVAGATVAFFAAFVLLGWLDRFASRGPAPIRVAREQEQGAPRINKADAHPDAPPRRPISAARDLGEPAPPSHPRVAEDSAAPEAEPLPLTVIATDDAGSPDAATVPASQPRSAQVSPRAVPPVLPPASTPRATAAPPAPASLGELMARLEQGLARREQEASPAEPAAAAASPAPAASPVSSPPVDAAPAAPPRREAPTPRGDRLQSAIDGLRALSASG